MTLGTHHSQVGNWNWFSPWLHNVKTQVVDIVYPLAVFVCVGVLVLVLPLFFKERSKRHFMNGLILVPLFSGLTFWFVTAPDPRFANAFFLLLPVSVVLILLMSVQNQVTEKAFLVIVCISFFVVNFELLHWAYQHKWTFKQVSLVGPQPLIRVPLNIKFTKSGLRVYVPAHGQQSWDAPLPCTPCFNADLRLRDVNDISLGFTVLERAKD